MFKIFHKHDFEEIQRDFGLVQKLSAPILGYKPVGEPEDYTLITYKCKKCPEHKQITLIGHIEKSQ